MEMKSKLPSFQLPVLSYASQINLLERSQQSTFLFACVPASPWSLCFICKKLPQREEEEHGGFESDTMEHKHQLCYWQAVA